MVVKIQPMSNKPVTIKAEGIAIYTDVMDEEDGTVKHTLVIYNEQFHAFCRQYENHKQITRIEIVKKRHLSSKGHDHFLRVASSRTNTCVVNDGVVPVKAI